MKQKLFKNGMILGTAIIISIILTLAVTEFSWSFNTFSDMLAYSGIVVLGFGAYIASNMSNMFSGTKRDINERYSPEEKLKKENLAKTKLINGWMMLATGVVVIILSMIVANF